MGISIGMVGLGAFGHGFVDLFKAHPLVDRIAFCDMEAERVKKWADDPFMGHKFNPKDAYSSLDDICKSDIDALAIITQPWLHPQQCIQAMKSGKHVFSAVPILWVPDGDEILDACDKLVATVKSTGMTYMLAETSYYHPEAMFLRRKRKEGAFGKFISSESEYTHDYATGNLRKVIAYRTASRIGSDWPEIIKSKYVSKGILNGPMHYPTHSVSGPASVMNAHALKVSAIGTEPSGYDDYFKNHGDAFGNETAFFHMSNGAVLTAREHREVAGDGYDFNIYGTCGTWRGRKWHWVKRTHNAPIEKPVEAHGVDEFTAQQMRDPLPRDVQEAFMLAQDHALTGEQMKNQDFTPKGHGGSHPYLVHEFVSALAQKRTPAISIWEAVRYMAMGVMAHKSALKSGELLAVPDWGDASGERDI